MKESFNEYMDRVSRARHILMGILCVQDFYLGVSLAHEFAGDISGGVNNHVRNLFKNQAAWARSKSIKNLTQALVAQDRILTYREDEV